MVTCILADNPKIGYRRALELSQQMVEGHKMAIFIMDLSFIGWRILGVLACCIGTIFVQPYFHATEAELYLVLRQNAINSGICGSGELGLDTM